MRDQRGSSAGHLAFVTGSRRRGSRVIAQRVGLATIGGLSMAASASTVTPQTTIQPSLAINYVLQTNAAVGDIGVIDMFAGTYVPSGTVEANGATLSISPNSTLYSQLGTTYGGNGTSTFQLPDLNGRTIIGTGAGPGLSSRLLGNAIGSDSNTVTTANLPPSAGGQGTPLNNMQPSLTLNYLIAVNGVYPSATSGGGSVGGTQQPYLGQIIPTASNYQLTQGSGQFLPADGQLLPISNNEVLYSLMGTTYGGNGVTTFALPDLRGSTPVGTGTGLGLTPRVTGSSFGTESTTLATANLPPPNGVSLPYSNMQPSLALNYIIATEGFFPGIGGSGSLDNPEPAIGQISIIAGNTIPDGWDLCAGQTLAIVQNQALFQILGTTYGGNGQTTFQLPDLQGRTATGADFGFGLNGLTSMTEGVKTGVENLSLTADQVPTPEPTSLLLLALAPFTALRRRRN